MSHVALKRCTKCGEEKPATTEFFHRDKRMKDGLRTMCKVCKNKEQKVYYRQLDVRERKLAYERRSERLEYHRDYKHRPENQESLSAYHKAHRSRPDIKVRRMVSVRNRRALLRRGASGIHTVQDIRQQYERQKGKCYWCSEKLVKYHVDHIIPLSRGGSNWPDNIVIACPTCNLSRKNKLPHEFAEGGKLL